MKSTIQSTLTQAAVVLCGAFFLATANPALAQDYGAPPPSFSTGQLDNLVSRIALYPDPLLAQVLAAASFPDQIRDAAQWASQYGNLQGPELADAIYQANLPFDPAVQALIPFPSVLQMMASDLNWTGALGNAVLADRGEVMDAVQHMRREASQYGYLQSNQQMRVVNTGYAVEIQPVNPALIYVPVYDPYIVYAPPRPGFFIGGAIGFGPCYSIGEFGDWGWGGGFDWYSHVVIVNRSPWGRTWYNRGDYVHNYGNWNRGEWRNNYASRGSYYNNRGYSNSYSDRGRGVYSNQQYRGAQVAPVVPNRGYQGNSYANSQQQYRGSQPQTRGYQGNSYANSQPQYRAPQITPNRSYQGSPYSNRGSYNSVRPAAPQVQSRNAYSSPQSSYRSAPPPQSHYSAPAPQSHYSAPARGNEGGHNDRGRR